MYGALEVGPFDSNTEIKRDMYEKSGSNDQYNNFIIDLPRLHTESAIGREFIA